MRRLGMRSKRKKSDATMDSGSEENGDAHNTTSESELHETKPSQGNEVDASAAPDATPLSRKTPAKKRTSRGRHSQKAVSEEPVEEGLAANTQAPQEQENGNMTKNSPNKRRKREDIKASTSAQNKRDSEDEYEVEKIVGHRTIKGRRQFLVRWKGYNEDSDTWENEKDLNCSKLIDDFLAEDAEQAEDTMPEMSIKSPKTKTPKSEKKTRKLKNTPKKQGVNDVPTDTKNEKDNQKEYEVERIIEVRFKKNKAREFLIRWKGFTAADDSWEPEENLNCPELIAKFMQKLEKAKTADMRELRTNPTHTKRYTLTTHESGRRLSRRNMDKQRATYHECDE